MLMQHGTQEQKDKYLPRMATGEVRGAFSMSEPGVGSDVAGITSKAVRDGDGWSLTGQKMWLTNGGSSTLVAVLVRADEDAAEGASVYKKMSTFLIEKESGFGEVRPGLTIPGKIEKMGYKGVDTTELIMDGLKLSNDDLLGGETGKGFYQMMDGVEVGRVNVAARAAGLVAGEVVERAAAVWLEPLTALPELRRVSGSGRAPRARGRFSARAQLAAAHRCAQLLRVRHGGAARGAGRGGGAGGLLARMRYRMLSARGGALSLAICSGGLLLDPRRSLPC
jgi:hypothetical protein